MKSRLSKNLNNEEAEELKLNFNSSLKFRKQLMSLLNEDIAALQNSMLSEENYNSENWQLIQVDRIAQIKSMKKVVDLLK